MTNEQHRAERDETIGVRRRFELLGGPPYAIVRDLKWFDDQVGRCDLCTQMFRFDQDVNLAGRSPAEHHTLWVVNAGPNSPVTGMPEKFTIYLRNESRNTGHHADWKVCWDHAYILYMDYQQIMLDELRDWAKTDRWMQTRMGRI